MDCFGVTNEGIEKERIIRKVQVKITGYDNLIPTYPIADAILKVEFAGKTLLETAKIPILTNYYIPTEYSFEIEYDWDSLEDRDKLISNPIILTLIETPGEKDPAMYNMPAELPPGGKAIWQSVESIAEIQEALLGEARAAEASAAAAAARSTSSGRKSSRGTTGKSSTASTSKNTGKTKSSDKLSSKSDTKSSKSNKKSDKKSDKSSKKKLKTTSKVEIKASGPVILGIGSIDLISIFLDSPMSQQSVLLKQYPPMLDERMIILTKLPVVHVETLVDPSAVCKTVFSLTVESIFNIPAVMSSELEYKVYIPFPSTSAIKEGISLTSTRYKMQKCQHQKKCWPSFTKDANPVIADTTYWISDDLNNIKNALRIDIESIWKSTKPRIEFNNIKRILMHEENIMFFKNQVNRYRKLPIEIFIKLPTSVPQAIGSKMGLKSDKGDKKGKKEKGSTNTKKSSEKLLKESAEPPDCLHLMGYLDLSRLLYPGVNRTRVVCPLRTYQAQEIKTETGFEDSFFLPKIIIPPVSATVIKPKKSTSKDKKSTKSGSKGSKSKGSKSKSGKSGSMRERLPPPPVIPPPSAVVYNEAGEYTYIIVEVELNAPLYPPRDLEDLADKLFQIIPQPQNLPKQVMSSRVTQEQYRETIRSLTSNLIVQYRLYKIERKRHLDTVLKRQQEFERFLKDNGMYQKYISSIMSAASSLANEYFCYTANSATEYQRFISEMYVYLITEVNKELNLALVGVPSANLNQDMDDLLHFAKEAIELRDFKLADRYLLQRIVCNEMSATYWFDYAVFYMSMSQVEDAFECTREALMLDTNHYNSLLLYAMLLERKNRRAEAETCMLTVVLNQSYWPEAWGALYILYQQHGNREGMEMCEEMGNKYLRQELRDSDETIRDDFAWTTAIIPNTLFYRSASFFVKIRLLDEAETALSNEIVSDPGIKEYFLAVIAYYRESYLHCMKHLDDAKTLHGCDFAVGSLRGHCFMHLGREKDALKEYEHILLSYSRPDDIHMLYMYSAFAMDKLNDRSKALGLMLNACKYSGTPLTWMGAGVLFYQLGDMAKADECLTYSNTLDNRLAEVWGYLVLVNLSLGYQEQADMCYIQAIKNGLDNSRLLEEIQKSQHKTV